MYAEAPGQVGDPRRQQAAAAGLGQAEPVPAQQLRHLRVDRLAVEAEEVAPVALARPSRTASATAAASSR